MSKVAKQIAEKDLKKPALFIRVEEVKQSHPCAQCIVVLNKMSPAEHCPQCVNEKKMLAPTT